MLDHLPKHEVNMNKIIGNCHTFNLLPTHTQTKCSKRHSPVHQRKTPVRTNIMTTDSVIGVGRKSLDCWRHHRKTSSSWWFFTTRLKNMRKSNWIIFPGMGTKKHMLEPAPSQCHHDQKHCRVDRLNFVADNQPYLQGGPRIQL